MAKRQKIRKLLRSIKLQAPDSSPVRAGESQSVLWDMGDGVPSASTQPAASVTIPFPVMTCVVCGRQEQAWGRYAGEWRTVPHNGHVYFACPGEFPQAGEPEESFQEAFRKILDVIGGLPNERKH